ncbi:putative lipoprotein [Malacoplasma penetrans HF-2]|uniref:Lipoprotein n=1 Tax=Malacoplasma penetrans (strain HF-2) TaxID=272633 RepID=Q8EV05_MALP2|nr:MG321/MPN456 family lipoprotein [Malacoplasma penetrans]BAC44556.1 putative lipoprotein [Malacoplasma penetrans HF-2]
MKRNKFFKLASSSILGVAITIGISSCSLPYKSNGVFQTYNSTDLLADNNSPLNNSFNNSPISTYAQSILNNLTTYQTVGDFSFSSNGGDDETTKDFLTLDGAKAVLVFKDQNTAERIDNLLKDKGFDITTNTAVTEDAYKNVMSSLKTDTKSLENSATSSGSSSSGSSSSTTSELKEGTDYWVFQRSLGALQFQNGLDKEAWDPANTNNTSNGQPSELTITSQTDYYKDAISSGTVYQFIIDTDNKWVDSKGNVRQSVSSKDYERSIESYSLAADLGYNRNGYFLSLIGLNFDKTLDYTDNNGGTSSYRDNNGVMNWENFDTTNWANKNDSIFTLYIDTPYPYTFGLISKEYFSALPHTNPEVVSINLKSGSPISYVKLGNTYSIDQSLTDWTRIYGSGGLGEFSKDVWYSGSYYISAFTSANLIFELNNVYMNTVGKDLLDSETGSAKTKTSKESKVKTISVVFGSGNDDTYYELFKSKQNDFLSAVPSNKMSDAASLFKDNGLVPKKIVQSTRSNYMAYTPNPYVVSSNGAVTENQFLGNMAKFLYQWNNQDAYTIRAGIAGLVNWYQLSLINLPISGDFQLSATPYGVFSGYYEQIEKGNMFGALPRNLSEYTSSNERVLSSGFTLPYYEYTTSGINIKNINVNKSTFIDALRKYGATTSNPLNFSIKFGESSFSTNYQNFLNAMKNVIEDLSDNLIRVTIVQRLANTPSATVWYNNQSSPLGFSYWSPDYNGVGTWVEADTTIETKTIGGQSVEGAPSTNAHNSFNTFLSSMVTAVKKMNANYNNGTTSGTTTTPGKYTVSTLETTNDPFKDDKRIQAAFSNTALEDMKIALKTNSTTSGTTTYDETYAATTSVSPGNRYGLLAIGLLNKLIANGVIDQAKFADYVTNPSKLLYSKERPSTYSEVWVGGDVIKSGKSQEFSKWLGVYAGEDVLYALYENTVLDSDYSFIPRSESGVTDKIYSLVNPNYTARVGTQGTNYRDFGWKK